MEITINKIIRTKRKTIALHITDNAALIVKAPFCVSDKTIMRIVNKHKKWIKRKKIEIETRNPKFTPKEFVNGEAFLYLGKYYKLRIVKNYEVPLVFENGFFLSKDYQPIAKELFIDWYKKKAYEKISQRVKWNAKKRDFKYNKMNITNARKRWGSCSTKGNLSFSWRLIMAPIQVVDYVVIHELVHLEEMNHSKLFWNKVKILSPNYKDCRNWLKTNGYLLRL